MRKILILSLFLIYCVSAFPQRLQRLTPGDPITTALAKVNKAIDNQIVKDGAIVYVIDYGIVADGSTNDAAAVQSAFDAAPAGSVIIFPAGKSIKISTQVYTEKQLTIIGNYCTIVCDANVSAFYLNVQDECVFKQFVFTGSGRSVSTKTDQVGLMFNAGVRHQISDLRFNSMSGAGLMGVNNYGESANLKQQGSNISNITLFNNKIGIALMARSEYNIMTNITAYENETGIQDNSGNNVLSGFSFEGNTVYGYRFINGNNVGHGSIGNGCFNHHLTYAIHANANGTGVLISNVNFYQGLSRFEAGTKNIIFSNCAFDGNGGAVTFDGATTLHNVVQNCLFTVAGTDPKTAFTATSSAKFSVINMRRADGSVFNFESLPSTILAAKTTNYTVTSGDFKYTLKADATAGDVTFSLPTAVGMDGQRITMMKIDASANNMVIDPNGTETVNGSSTSISINTQWANVTLESNGTNWIRLFN